MPATSLPAQPAPLLDLRGVTVTPPLADQVVLAGPIDWRIRAGDYWAVGGLPGVGKSALLQTLIGLQQPAAGQVMLFGRHIRDLSEEELVRLRRRTGLVFEGAGRLFYELTIAENIGLPWRYHHDCEPEAAAERVGLLLVWAGLEAVAHLRPVAVARALQLRAALARAVIMQPEVLLLDNPLRGLETAEARWWLDRLDELAAGSPVGGGQAVTVVAAADDLRPWIERARQFAVIRDSAWLALSGREAAHAHAGAGWDELLAKPGETI